MSFKLMMIFLSPPTEVVAAVPTASAGVVSVSGGVVSVSGGVVVAAVVDAVVVAEGTSRRSGKMNISARRVLLSLGRMSCAWQSFSYHDVIIGVIWRTHLSPFSLARRWSITMLFCTSPELKNI